MNLAEGYLHYRYNPNQYDKPQQPASIDIRESDNGRRKLETHVGTMSVEVLEIPSDQLTDDSEEWQTIQAARQSYFHMWGEGNGLAQTIEEDPFDGRGDTKKPYKVWHYIATVKSQNQEDKIITMRKLYYPLRQIQMQTGETKEQLLDRVSNDLPEDISFWEIFDPRNNIGTPLWTELRSRMEKASLINFSAISRSGTTPYVVTDRSERSREQSGIAFSAIQLLAADRDTGDLIFAQQCEEFPKRVFKLEDINGRDVILDFTHVKDTLSLPEQQILRLNRNHPVVLELLATFPGYWTDNAKAATRITELMVNGEISQQTISNAWNKLKSHCENDLTVLLKLTKDLKTLGITIPSPLPDNINNIEKNAVKILTSSRYFKYIVPIERDSALYDALIYESGDGPYPSAMIPSAWKSSAENLLRKAQEKYKSELKN